MYDPTTLSGYEFKMDRLMVIRNFAPGTRDNYLHSIRELAKSCQKPIEDITPHEVQEYLYALIRRGQAWNTVHTKIYGIKFFFRYVMGRPPHFFYIPAPKRAKRLPIILSPKEIARIIDQAPDLKSQTMIRTAYASGLRLSELVHLRIADVDSEHMVLWVRSGKGNKDRAAYLSPTLLRDLRKYWLVYRPKVWLFPWKTHPEKPMRPGNFGMYFGKLKRNAGIRQEGGIHCLRHAFASHQVAQGVPVETVQQLLGHKNLHTTMIYVHLAKGILLSKGPTRDLLDNKDL